MDNQTITPTLVRRGWPKGKPRKPRTNKKELGQQLLQLSEQLKNIGNKVTELDAKLFLIKNNI